MSRLSMVEEKLPPGFRFHPRDDELVCDYLLKKMNGCDESSLFIDVDLNKCEPWDIPETACVGGKEWYFYSQRDKKYATGLRTNRATISGYWKATGKDRPIARKESLIGMRKTLVFYQGRAPKGKKTDWVMHEFRLEGPFGPSKNSTFKEDWVLCRVFYKNKEVPAKSGINESNTTTLQEETGSSSLPALMDTYITFDQTQTEQVPCFSIFPGFNNQQNNPTPTYFPLDPNNMRSTATVNFGSGGFTQENVNEITNLLSNPWSCDKKVIEAMLSHLTKIESSPNPNIKGSPSLGETSCESYLSEAGLPTVWNHY